MKKVRGARLALGTRNGDAGEAPCRKSKDDTGNHGSREVPERVDELSRNNRFKQDFYMICYTEGY